MVNRLLFKLTSRLRCRLIHVDGSPYLERYYVGSVLDVALYLHRFVGCDGDRHQHNHPYSATSIVLTGGYVEEIMRDFGPNAMTLFKTRAVRWVNRIASNRFHRIASVTPGTWTLFIRGPRDQIAIGMVSRPKSWGFIERGQFVPAKAERNPDGWHTSAPYGCAAGRVPL
jgi:hypothetical protein